MKLVLLIKFFGADFDKKVDGKHTHVHRMDDEQAKRIENSVLKRCSPQGPVMHIYVDRKSTFVSYQ